jgi:predicted phosphodiesterase
VGVTVAALYDVHGNLPALEAVLADVEREQPDVVVFGGDLVWGPWPQETLELAETLGSTAVFIRGNCERLVLEGASPAHAWARDRLDEAARERIRTWPLTRTREIEGLGRTLFCHATPRSEDEIVTPDSPPDAWKETFGAVEANVAVCGHTHLQFDLMRAGRRIVSPGSVGAPTVRSAAWWALLGPEVELRTTEYDTESTIAAARHVVPDATGFERWLREPPTYGERMASLTAS